MKVFLIPYNNNNNNKTIFFFPLKNLIIYLGDPEIISNLIRFINEFWYVKSDKFSSSVEEVIKNDSTCSNININMKLRKFNAIEDILTYVQKYKEISNK